MPDFDPYHRWLGITPDERPISKYRLLGIAEFEVDRDVITLAAERQTVFLRTMQAGEHADLVAQLLNEVSQARVTLLDPEKKSDYDAQLRNERSPKEAEPAPAAAPAVQSAAPVVNLPLPSPLASGKVRTTRKRTVAKPIWKRPVVIGLSIAGGLLVSILVFMTGGGDVAPVAVTPSQSVSSHTIPSGPESMASTTPQAKGEPDELPEEPPEQESRKALEEEANVESKEFKRNNSTGYPTSQPKSDPEPKLEQESGSEPQTGAKFAPETKEEIAIGNEPAMFTEPNAVTATDVRYKVPDPATSNQIRERLERKLSAEFESIEQEQDPSQKNQKLLDMGQAMFVHTKATHPLDPQNGDIRYVMFVTAYYLIFQSGNETVSNEVLTQLVAEFTIEEWQLRSHAIEFWAKESKNSPVPVGTKDLLTQIKLFQMATDDAGKAYSAGSNEVGKRLLDVARSLVDLLDHDNFPTEFQQKELKNAYITMFNQLKKLDDVLVIGGRPDIAYEVICLARDIAIRGEREPELKECDERLKVLKKLME